MPYLQEKQAKRAERAGLFYFKNMRGIKSPISVYRDELKNMCSKCSTFTITTT